MEAKSAIEQWGISLEEVDQLGERLTQFYGRFRRYLHTKTRNTSEYGLGYLSGLLRMETKRNMANVGWKTAMAGQNLQYFMSNSPWSGPGLIEAIQTEIKGHPVFQEAMLVLDESAEAKAGEQSAGAGRQYNGSKRMKWRFCHNYQLVMCENCCGLPCRCHSFPLKRQPNWSLRIW